MTILPTTIFRRGGADWSKKERGCLIRLGGRLVASYPDRIIFGGVVDKKKIATALGHGNFLRYVVTEENMNEFSDFLD